MRVAFLVVLLFVRAVCATNHEEEEELRRLVAGIMEQNYQLRADLSKLQQKHDADLSKLQQKHDADLSQLQQKHGALVASTTAQRQEDARWQRETTAKLQSLVGGRRSSAPVSAQRRGLSSGTCADPSGPRLLVDGVCSCTGGLLVEGRNITKELDVLVEAAATVTTTSTPGSTSVATSTSTPTATGCLGNITLTSEWEIDTKGARDWEHFTVDNELYLAVANYEARPTYQLESVIYHYNNATGEFDVNQEIDTKGAFDWEHFTVDNEHYLAVANHYDGSTRQLKSVIYHYNNATGEFDVNQEIDTKGAPDWEHFTVDNEHYLAVANYHDGSTYQIKSVIYHYNNATGEFDVNQEIDTKGARDWEHFTVDNEHYLAVANYADGSTSQIKSVIYHYNRATGEFEVNQEIDTKGAFDWEHFTVDNEHYLAVANYDDGSTRQLKSVIYHYNRVTGEFEVNQEIDTKAANDWEHFTVDNEHYLAVANYHDGSTFQIKSVIYHYNRVTGEFEVNQEIDTKGATDWEHFTVNNKHYLAMANLYDGSTFRIKSVIYLVDSVC